MSIRLGKNSFFFVFLVLFLVGASQARNLLPLPHGIGLQFQRDHAKAEENDLIHEWAELGYIGDLHATLLNKYGAELLWWIYVVFCLCFSVLFTNLLFRVISCIAHRCSFRFLKSNTLDRFVMFFFFF